MTLRQEIENALAVLESHRDLLDPEVADTAVAALQDKLIAAQSTAKPDNQKQMAVLVADLSGFTAMSELMDVEEVRDTINAIWQKLDKVIAAWGGQIDQHIGDAVVALYSIKSSVTDCAERAVLSALDMQQELALFNQKQQKGERTYALNHLTAEIDFKMRVGIHLGPVMFGKMGSSLQYTAVGDTITITNQLEKAAPVGGILISETIYEQVYQQYETEIVPPVPIETDAGYITAHAVQKEKQHNLQNYEREISSTETRFVGRTAELEQLQFALAETAESHATQIITVTGDAGVGKTRLRQEFEKYLAIQPTPIHLFKGQAQKGITAGPYAVVHHMLANFFDIHPRSSSQVARNKLIKGILGVLSADDPHARERAHFIGHLLNFDLSQSTYLQRFKHDARRIREYGFQDLALFFSAVSEERPTVLLLDDMELADPDSFEFLEYLVDVCRERPLLIVCFGEKQLTERWATLKLHQKLQPHKYHPINLKPLSLINNRHLIADRLQNIPRQPQRLTDLLAEGANGNPYLITELIEMLSDVGVIIKGSQYWRIQMSPLSDLRGRLSLEWLVQKQLERLSPLEREIIQKAAVVGETFWESTVSSFKLSNNAATERQIRAAINNLEKQELIRQRWPSAFANSREFQFRHKRIHKLIYNSLPAPERQTTHAQCATWLLNQQATHLHHIFATIAWHLEQAGDGMSASNWYGRAADQASHNFTLTTTIQLYQKALDLLPATEANKQRRNQLTIGLGQVLRQQGRFDEASRIYSQLHQQAVAENDLDTAVRVFNDSFIILSFQGEYQNIQKITQTTEKMTLGHETFQEMATAKIALSWTYAHLGQLEQAVTYGKEALAISTKANAKREMAYSHALLGTIAQYLHRLERAKKATQTAIGLFREINDRPWRVLMLHRLGEIAWLQQELAQAETHFRQGMEMARDMGDVLGAIHNTLGLSKVAEKRQDFAAAEEYAQQALVWAEKSGNARYKIMAAVKLSRVYLAQEEIEETAVNKTAQLNQARHWLEHIQQAVEQCQQPHPCALWQIEMTRLLQAEKRPAQALTQIQSALKSMNRSEINKQGIPMKIAYGIAWRELANVAAQMPPGSLPLYIESHPYQVVDCYQKSLQILSELKKSAKVEIAHTLFAWAVYEIRANHHARGETLWHRALDTYTKLDLKDEIAKMERFVL